MTVCWKITAATALSGHRLALRFEDGLSGEVVLEPAEFTGALARLGIADYFGQVRVLDGVPTWPEGEDLAPDSLYADVKALHDPARTPPTLKSTE